MGKTINIDITAAGSVKVDALGFQGNECDKATEQIELVLGGGQVKKDKKPEYHMPPSSTQNHNKRTF